MNIAIFGTSGFAREVADICWAIGYSNIVFIGIDPNQKVLLGYDVIHESCVKNLYEKNYDFVIGIGDNSIRAKISQEFDYLKYVNIIHPSASFGKGQLVTFNQCIGNVITAGVRFTNNIEVGNFGIYNLNSTIGHDCKISDYVNLSPNSSISGNVTLGNRAFIGTNATIIQGKIIGKCSVIGAGAVVIDHIPNNCTAVGVPAKIIKTV
ncbi:sugar O-acyltransferase, sialic acid O-acetyltransferase NeuD family [Desulfosporosinus orientis DSM 765]|uniref:Sugar O-acyltransferase, sialic acid O-acetyltransferase NeuD family n=1 Tax=Desulfosporosinus orientis (strain ATCC 19365 / DSM 765 / NCIMB 8382 / VKM B-1628 / Singapore I) TaxID=768706 RepID=G7W543_DESOD|nr:NeuD/PglB/VioB family sugar acetyltransferase [Desulfosporosinus orientis]AET66059.1 sugar O-acyltransferase, sialic acid O-acetyltransferase NeuD family [Desulfosporosinus orientis DSM 765]